MKSYLVFPIHDPNGGIIDRLQQALPTLKTNFDQAFISITPLTAKQQKEKVALLQNKSFFVVNFNSEKSGVADHHLSAYRNALLHTQLDDALHLCTPDRLVFGINQYRETFIKDLKQSEEDISPTIFHRSEKAWKTHPANYRAIESLITTLGKKLFGKEIDYAWCHITVKNRDLKKILPLVKSRDLVMYAELAAYLAGQAKTKEVDWLSWEDPFIFGKDPVSFKKEREKDPEENKKRLSYALPMIDFLLTRWQRNLRQ